MVTFQDGGNSLGTAPVENDGYARLRIPILGAAVHTITAVYNGNTVFARSNSNPLTQIVEPATTSISLGVFSNPSTEGDTVTFSATVSTPAPGSGRPTGTVTFRDGGASLGTATLDTSGRATLETDSLSVGVHSFTALYGGDNIFVPSASNSVSHLVNPTACSGDMGAGVSADLTGDQGNGGAQTSDGQAAQEGIGSVGHHPVGPGVMKQVDTCLLSKEAREVFAGAWSGPTNPPHGFQRLAGVAPKTYTTQTADLLKRTLRAEGITIAKPMTGERALRFVRDVWNGTIGTPEMARYNNEVRRTLVGGPPGFLSQTATQIAQQGRTYVLRFPERFKSLFSGVELFSIAETLGLLILAGTSRNYQSGMEALNAGDFGTAERKLIGKNLNPGNESFVQEIIATYAPGHVLAGITKAREFEDKFRAAIKDAEELREKLLKK
jgi:hypothetical protein